MKQAFLCAALAFAFTGCNDTPQATPEKPAPTVIALGDSLTAGYGISQDKSFPAQLEKSLSHKGVHVHIMNAGVAGDTTTGSLRRLDWLLGHKPNLVLVAVGANDALREIPIDMSEKNLASILDTLKQAQIPAILVGVKAPESVDPAYAAEFNAIYPRLAQRFDVPFYPNMLEKVDHKPHLKQADGLHPNAKGARIMARDMTPLVMRTLKQHP